MTKWLWLVLVFLVAGCTDPGTTRRLVEQDGVTKVEITGYRLFACSKDDWYATGFRGEKAGKPVGGVVCGGFLFKSNTLRYD